jgi:hypothetical protein
MAMTGLYLEFEIHYTLADMQVDSNRSLVVKGRSEALGQKSLFGSCQSLAGELGHCLLIVVGADYRLSFGRGTVSCMLVTDCKVAVLSSALVFAES